MAPIVNGTAPSEPIKIQNGFNDNLLNQDVVKLENLPKEVKELCLESLKVILVFFFITKYLRNFLTAYYDYEKS